MKKRLTCLLLCLVMLLSLALTACSSKSEEEAAQGISDEASASAKTLTMWIVSENEVSEETAKLVTQELNDITKAKFKTQLIVKFLTKDVYEQTVSETIENYEKAKENGGVSEDDSAVEETETLDNGMTIIKYPDPVPYQVDIVYIAGEEMFLDYVDNGWLYALDDELNGASKKIKEYVSDTLLSAAKLDGTTYAVPNNNVIGEYTYMLLNKELMNKYSQQGYVTLGMIDGFYNTYLFNYLKQIHLFEPDVIPVNSTYEECLSLLAHYWSVDPSNYSLLQDFSVFGHHYTDIASLSRGSVILGYDSLFENPDFCADFLKLNELKYDGYFSEDTNKTAAVKFVKGDSTVLKQYEEDYYSVIVEYPTASSDDIYSNMFGVCTYSKSLDRSMQVITYLNTNEAFRNILQYGVENKHYKMVVDEDTGKTSLERINNDYMMDIYATGNAFLAYPEPDMSEDIWEMGKIQNRGSLVNPLLGFNIKDFAITAGTVTEELELSKDGYNISCSTGYSKDVLCQDDDLESWIESCDKAGDGVYLLKTSTVSGQNVNCTYYVYNTLIAGAKGLEVVPTPYFTTVEDSKTGNEKEVLESVEFILDYTEDDSATRGYELSVVSLYIKKTTPYDFICQNNGGEVSYTESKYDKHIVFDFLNTEEYSIDFYANITKTNVLKNTGLMAWLKACDETADKKKETTTFVKTYRDEVTGEQTFIVYQTGMEYITTVDFTPTGDQGELNLGFNFNVIKGKDYELSIKPDAEIENQDREYLLYYVRVNPTNPDLTVSYSVTKNGEKTSVTEEKATEDPDFEIIGNLDTELIKYMHQLNKELNEVINSCTNYEELEAVVAEISLLLSTDPEVDLTDVTFVKLKDCIKNGVIANDLKTLHEYVISATSTSIIKHEDGDGNELNWEDPISKLDEVYVYYDSLYGLYHQWMTKYGFLPKS